MQATTQSKHEAVVLDAIFKNVKMASDSILNLMPKVQSQQLKSDLTVQLSTYEAFASRAAKQLGKEGIKPQEENWMTRMGAKWGTMMNTMKDSTTSHLVEMVIEGTTMGVNDMMEQMRICKHAEVSDSVRHLAQDVLDYEEKVLRDMKEYLK